MTYTVWSGTLNSTIPYHFDLCVELISRDSFYVVLFLCYLCVLSLGCSCWVVSTSASDWLERLVSDMTYNVLMGTLNPTHSHSHAGHPIWTGHQSSHLQDLVLTPTPFYLTRPNFGMGMKHVLHSNSTCGASTSNQRFWDSPKKPIAHIIHPVAHIMTQNKHILRDDQARWEVSQAACAVAQHCYNGDVSFLWEKWKLWPRVKSKPLNRLTHNLSGLITSTRWTFVPNLVKIRSQGTSGQRGEI